MLGELATHSRDGIIHSIGRTTIAGVTAVGDLSLFGFRMVRWIFARRQRSSVLLANMHAIGVQSLPVVLITGLFIGMVLSVQTYDQFKALRMESRLGAVINVSLVRELGPVLAATMLAGRVGSSMAAELGTSSETLSRTLARLRDAKLITVAAKSITVSDPAALAALLRRNLGEG